jgi:hypothetical protein
MQAHFRHLHFKNFQWHNGLFNSMSFDPLKSLFEDLRVHRVHSFTLSYTPRSMKCDFRASFLARTFASPYLGHKPKAKVTT